MKDQEAYELIEKYLLDQMDQEERNAFEARLKSDDALRTSLEDVSISVKATQNKALLNELRDIHTDLYETPARQRKQYLKLAVAIAAGVAVIIVSVLSLISFDPPHELLFSKYFEPFPDYISMRNGQQEYPSFDGMDAYSNGNYDKAITVLKQQEKDNDGNTDLLFYLGVSYLANGEAEIAQKYFKRPVLMQSKYAEQVRWYLALSYLKAGKQLQALSTLKTIEAGTFEYEKASLLINELQNADF